MKGLEILKRVDIYIIHFVHGTKTSCLINENVIRANRSNLLIGEANYQTINDLKVRRAF